MSKEHFYFSRSDRRAAVSLLIIIVLVHFARYEVNKHYNPLPVVGADSLVWKEVRKSDYYGRSGSYEYNERSGGSKTNGYSKYQDYSSDKRRNYYGNKVDGYYGNEGSGYYRNKGDGYYGNERSGYYGNKGDGYYGNEGSGYYRNKGDGYYGNEGYGGSRKDSVGFGDSVFRKRPVYQKKLPFGTVVDINTADTALLKGIPGIGSFYARRIVEYRSKLGGYTDVKQLSEIENLPDSVQGWFKMGDSIDVIRIEVNGCSLQELMAHPYISFYQARAITEFRRAHGELQSLSQLSMLPEFSDAEIERLAPYLRF